MFKLRKGAEPDPIHLELVDGETPYRPFEVLSCAQYARSEMREVIFINGESKTDLQVPASVQNMLRNFRSPDQDKYIYLFIETGKMMSHNRAFKKKFKSTLETASVLHVYLESSILPGLAKAMIQPLDTWNELVANEGNWTALYELLNDPWFHRLWAIPELVFSKKTVAHVANIEVDWNIFHQCASFITWKAQRHKGSVPSGSVIEQFVESFNRKQTFCLEELLCQLSHLKVPEPHDTIYALLPLADDVAGKNLFRVDYDIPILQLWTRMIEHQINFEGSIDTLFRPVFPTHESIPSWIRSKQIGHLGSKTKSFITPYKRPDIIRNASGNHEAKAIIVFSDYEKSYVLYVTGLRISKIWTAVVNCPPSHIPSEFFRFTKWNDTSTMPPYLFWNTLIAGKGLDGRKPHVSSDYVCRAAFSETSTEKDVNISELNTYRETMTEEYLERMNQCVEKRRFFFTESPSSGTGIGPEELQEGDLIYVLLGCSVPVVLRPELDSFRLIGEAFFSGFMHNEEINNISSYRYQKLRII